MAASNWTLDQVLDQLNSGSAWSDPTITYSFPSSKSEMYKGGGEGGGFEALTANQITFIEYALEGWDDLMDADFLEVSSNSDIEVANTTTGIDYAHAYFPTDGSVWLNPDYDDIYNPVIGDYGYATIIHELGHALGLDHMGDYNGNDNNGPSSYQDSSVLSVMSYYGPDNFDGEGQVMWADWKVGGVTYSTQTPMLNDIMAIQSIYGVETTTRTGDTVYGFNSNITGSASLIFDFSKNDHPILTIFDSSGEDTLDLSGYSTHSAISLVSGTFTHCNAMTYNIAIAYSATIENAVGGAGDDEITGNGVANQLTGGAGNDTIEGGDGTDTAIFSGKFANYTITTTGAGAYTVTDNVGGDGQDTLTSIEKLQFKDKTFEGGDINNAPAVAHEIADQAAVSETLYNFVVPSNSFSDADGDALSYSATLADGSSLPDWLSFDTASMTFSGTPTDTDKGTLSIKVTASDGKASVSDIFSIAVAGGDAGSNTAPLAIDDSASTLESKSILVDVLANDFDMEGDDLAITSIDINTGEGSAAIENGKIRFDYGGADLAAGESATISIGYTVSDGTESDYAVLTMTVTGQANEIKGDGKANKLSGTGADDFIYGLGGKDRIFGKGGEDILDGGKGRDFLWGNDGADIFAFGSKNGRDDIMDFSQSEGDRIDLSDVSEIVNFKDLVKHHLFVSDGNALIEISNKDDIWVWDVNPNKLDKSDFIF